MTTHAAVTHFKAQMRQRTPVFVATAVACALLAALPRVDASQGGERRQGAGATHATIARTISLIANAHLHISQVNENKVVAQGAVSGTLSGTLSTHITINSGGRMTSWFTGTSRAGTLSGWGVSNYGVSGSTLYYSGTGDITHGTGYYAHAHATGVRIEGTLNRRQRRLTAVINGRLHI